MRVLLILLCLVSRSLIKAPFFCNFLFPVDPKFRFNYSPFATQNRSPFHHILCCSYYSDIFSCREIILHIRGASVNFVTIRFQSYHFFKASFIVTITFFVPCQPFSRDGIYERPTLRFVNVLSFEWFFCLLYFWIQGLSVRKRDEDLFILPIIFFLSI